VREGLVEFLGGGDGEAGRRAVVAVVMAGPGYQWG